MSRAFIVSGVLGLGTVLVFGAAMLASVLFPNGGTVNAGWNQWGRGGLEKGIPVPMPAVEPAIDVAVPEKGFVVEPSGDVIVRADDVAVDQP